MVTIRFFAQLRDVVGTDSLQFAADDLEQVYAHLQRTLGAKLTHSCERRMSE